LNAGKRKKPTCRYGAKRGGLCRKKWFPPQKGSDEDTGPRKELLLSCQKKTKKGKKEKTAGRSAKERRKGNNKKNYGREEKLRMVPGSTEKDFTKKGTERERFRSKRGVGS